VLTEAGRNCFPCSWLSSPGVAGGPPPRVGPRCCSGTAAAGSSFTPAVSCGACGQPLRPGEVEVLRGPGACTSPGTAILSQATGGRARQL